MQRLLREAALTLDALPFPSRAHATHDSERMIGSTSRGPTTTPMSRHFSGSAADAFVQAWVSFPCCIAGTDLRARKPGLSGG